MLEIKMHHKTKVDQQHRFFLRIFFPTHFDLWKGLKKFRVGGVGGVVDFLNIVSTPGPVLSRSRLGLVRLVTRLS